MKFSTSTIVCTAILSSSTALAGTPIERRQIYNAGNTVANSGNPYNNVGAVNYANANAGWAAAKRQVPAYNIPAGAYNYANAGWAAAKRQAPDSELPAPPRLTAKQRAIARAQRHNATEAQITFLNTVPDETFEKMSTMRRKFGQAMGQLWKGTVPDLAALPTEGARPPRAAFMRRPGGAGEGKPEGGRASPKEWLMRWAAMGGASAEQIQALKDTPETEFEGLKELPLKERLVKEAELMKSDKVEFFKTGVPQAFYDELTTLETTVREAHKKLKNGEMPTL